eukprot:scaffold7745_cov103-Cylindrotheca_fusiformis.AAC.4
MFARFRPLSRDLFVRMADIRNGIAFFKRQQQQNGHNKNKSHRPSHRADRLNLAQMRISSFRQQSKDRKRRKNWLFV